MKTSTVLGFLGAGVALMLLTKKTEAAAVVPTPKVEPKTTPKATTPKTNPKATTPKTTTPKDPALSTYEQFQLDTWTDAELFEDAMTSTSKQYVKTVANRLAEHGDTNAAELTQRLANWSA